MLARGTRWVVALAVVTLAVPAIAGADGTPVISAHRAGGVSGFAENSLAAFESAARGGETDIEGDVYATKDGRFVMSHDSPLRAPQCSGPHLGVSLRALTAAQVAEMDCFGQPVARVDQVLDAVRPYPAATVRIEVKNEVNDSGALRTADAVNLARLFATAGMTQRSILQDSDWASTTRAVLAASPSQRVSALSASITMAEVASARSLGVTDFSYVHTLATGFWNQAIAAQGLTSTVWTVNDTLRARVLRAEGVGTLITNIPATLRLALADPASGCTLTPYTSTGVTRGTSLAGGAHTDPTAPRLSPDGRVVEKARVRVRAWTSSGTASLRIAPQGTADGSQWEQPLAVGTTARTTVIEVPLGDAGRLRIRNASSRTVRLEVALVGGTVYDCP